jgi:hypothetical protein
MKSKGLLFPSKLQSTSPLDVTSLTLQKGLPLTLVRPHVRAHNFSAFDTSFPSFCTVSQFAYYYFVHGA